MENLIFSQEIIEKILSYVDGETLLVCQQVSPQFAAAVLYLTSKNIWKKCCYQEIVKKSTIFQIISKLYPHTEGFNHPKDWKLIYECWSSLKRIASVKNWNVSALQIGNQNAQVCDVFTHGNLILALLKYNKDFSIYNKIKTISDTNVVVDKSSRFNAESLYITPIENLNVADDAILLYCEICKLIGIPAGSSFSQRNYPKIHCNSNTVTVEHYNGDFLCFNNTFGLFGRSKCIGIGRHPSQDEQSIFVNVSFKFSYLYIACDDVHREFNTIQSLHAKVTCAKAYANLILLGTETGMLYGYYCKDKNDVLELDLENYIWCFDVSADPLLAIDVMTLENQLGIVCSNKKCVYQLTANQ